MPVAAKLAYLLGIDLQKQISAVNRTVRFGMEIRNLDATA